MKLNIVWEYESIWVDYENESVKVESLEEAQKKLSQLNDQGIDGSIEISTRTRYKLE